jgi:hypothetical protein
LVTKGKTLQYEEERDSSLWKRYVDKEKSGRMVSSIYLKHILLDGILLDCRHITAMLVRKKKTTKTTTRMEMEMKTILKTSDKTSPRCRPTS